MQRRAAVLHRAGERPQADREQEREHEHDGRVTEREEEADAERTPAVGQQLARRVVDRRDVVGVERVTEAERVGRDSEPEPEHAPPTDPEVVRHDQREQEEEADRVQCQHDRPEACQAAPLSCAQAASHAHSRAAATAAWP